MWQLIVNFLKKDNNYLKRIEEVLYSVNDIDMLNNILRNRIFKLINK